MLNNARKKKRGGDISEASGEVLECDFVGGESELTKEKIQRGSKG